MNFEAEAQSSGPDQASTALFAKKANEGEGDSSGIGEGKHGLFKMGVSLEKILTGPANIEVAAKALEGLAGNLQGALTPLTTPLSGIMQVGPTHLNIIGINLLGEKKHMNLNATAEEIVGSIGSSEVADHSGGGDDGGYSSSGESGDDSQHLSQHGEMFDQGMSDSGSHGDEGFHDDLVSAGQKILSGGGGGEDHDHFQGVEHHESASNYVPSSTPSQTSQSHGHEYD